MSESFTVSHLTHALLETKRGLYIAPERKTLASGRISCLYFNIGDEVISYPRIRNNVIEALELVYRSSGLWPGRWVGVPEGANCLAAILAEKTGIGQLRVRETQTDHGDQRSIEGYFEPNMTVGVIEDVISTGGSTITRAIEPVKAVGLKPYLVIALIDRQYGGVPKLKDFGLTVKAFTTTTEIAKCLINESLVNDQQIRLLKEELEELKNI